MSKKQTAFSGIPEELIELSRIFGLSNRDPPKDTPLRCKVCGGLATGTVMLCRAHFILEAMQRSNKNAPNDIKNMQKDLAATIATVYHIRREIRERLMRIKDYNGKIIRLRQWIDERGCSERNTD